MLSNRWAFCAHTDARHKWLESRVDLFSMFQFEHVPLHTTERIFWQAGHILFILHPFCFAEKFACAQQIVICQKVLRRRLTVRIIVWIAKFANCVHFDTHNLRSVWHEQTQRAVHGVEPISCFILAHVGKVTETLHRGTICSSTFLSSGRGHFQFIQIDLATGWCMWDRRGVRRCLALAPWHLAQS